MSRRRRLYFAAPLFTPTERQFNAALANTLSITFDVFLPQRDGVLLVEGGRSLEQERLLRDTVFAADVAAVRDADVIFAVLDGRTVDEGVAFELGLAFGLAKQCIGFRSDSRVLIQSGVNPMIEKACSTILDSEDSLRDWLAVQ